MPYYDVDPLIGIGPVRLGMTRDEVLAAMGEQPRTFRKTPLSTHEADAFRGASFQVFYSGDTPRVEYIELSRRAQMKPRYRGISVFETPAEQLVELISRDAPYDAARREIPDSYIFPTLELSLWRPHGEGEAGRFFSTVGIGDRGYYSNP